MQTHGQAWWRPAFVALLAMPVAATAQLKINEVYYRLATAPGANQFVELFNAGTNTVYLDGLILTEEALDGVEGVFRFPGGGTDHPVPPGGYVVIAADADDSDGDPPHLGTIADWECYAGPADFDNPLVPNLVLVGGFTDLSLFSLGDNVILADGTDLTVPIDPATFLDSMNYGGDGGGELAPLTAEYEDASASVASATNASLLRCPDGHDTDYASASDFLSGAPTPGAANPGGCPSRIFARPAAALEGDTGSVTVRMAVVRSLAGGPEVTVTCRASEGTASAGADYVAFTNLLVFPTGVGTQWVDVVVLGDTLVEPEESIVLRFFDAVNAEILASQVVVRVLDNDLPVVSVFDATVREGHAGITTAVFAVQLSSVFTNPVTVQGITSNGTALAGSDYTAASTTLLFAAGTTSQFIRVNVLGDTDEEATEIFFVHLRNPTNATLGNTPATGTIQDDDSGAVVTPDLWISDASVTEGNAGFTAAVFTVTLSTSSPFTVSVLYATASGSATAPADYTAIASTLLSFPPGTTSQAVNVSVAGDLVVEPDQTFLVNLSGAVNATLVDAQGIGTILDDDDLAVTCPGTITALVASAEAGTNVFFSATVTSNECGASIASAPTSGSFFVTGTSVVTATATDTCGHSATCSFDVVVLSVPTGGVLLGKTVYAGHDAGASAPGAEALVTTGGAAITYCFVVTNSGELAFTNVVLTDAALPGFTSLVLGALAPGGVATGFFETIVGDSITNEAVATGWAPDVPPVTGADTCTVVVLNPGLALSKTVYLGHDAGASGPGGEYVQGTNGTAVTYFLVVGNAGDVALADVTIEDASLGIAPMAFGVLQPGEAATGYVETVIGADLVNVATASGEAPGGIVVQVSDSAEVDQVLAPDDCPGYLVIGLGTLGGDRSAGLGLNDFGQAVGWARDADGTQCAVLWEAGGITNLGMLPGGTNAVAWGINNSGQISGWSDATGTVDGLAIEDHAFRYETGVMTDLGTLGGKRSRGLGINAAGDVVGLSFRRFQTFNLNPFLHTKGTNVGLEVFCGVDDPGTAYDVNDFTQVVGHAFAFGCSLMNGARPFVWQDFNGDLLDSPGEMIDLGTFGGGNGVARGINNQGQIVGSADWTNGMRRAFLVTAQTNQWFRDVNADKINDLMTDLGALGAYTEATAINESGVIVGFSTRPSGNNHAFRYKDGAMVDLNDLIDPGSGWEIIDAAGINEQEQIVGTGILNGLTQAVLLVSCNTNLAITRLIAPLAGEGSFHIIWQAVSVTNAFTVETSTSLETPAWAPAATTGAWPIHQMFELRPLDTNDRLRFFRIRAGGL